ncbi:tail tape measure protein [Salmonella enterica subsp. enterica]|nr:tail tape measure protein [Salmonella enterica subsp. enterica serovar Poona]ECC9215408.1 tail tape measure protein [Salmonella enterica subsp. enterica]ECD2404437.1 tail tape measure protein [Salmonella enterica subsp. enterica serovar Richmond]ECG3311751.1 tail tape measure protein [Salmonella enterica subsp. enterica serovar Richmond]
MKNLKASLIVDLLGNISSKSRQWSQDLGAFSHAGQRGLGGVGTAVRRLGGDAEISSSRMRQAFRGMRSGVNAVSADLDRLKLSAEGAFGKLTHLYGLLTGGAAVYGFKKAFIDPAAAMENYTIRLNSINHGDKAKTEATKAWAIQNAKDTTWGLSGVMQEYASSRGFGMNDAQAKKFITMLQDQGGYHGWSLSDAQGASLQLKQMYARQSIQAQDANLLTGYGINVYQLLADKLGVNQKIIRDKGEHGLLGPESIRLLFQIMAEQAAGAQKNAMNSWTGLTSQMGDVWEQFSRRVMDAGTFAFLKTQISGILDLTQDARFNEIADDIGRGMLTAFTSAKDAVTWLVEKIKAARQALKQLRDDGYGKTLDNIASGAKTLAKYLLYVYAARTALRLAGAVGMGALRLGATPLRYTLSTVGAVTSPFRKRRPVMPGELPGRGGRFMNFLSGVNPAAVQPVFVTNWPAGALAGAGGNGGNTLIEEGGKKRRSGRTKKGPGKGRGISTVVTAGEELAESAAKKGLFGRMVSRVGGWFGKIPGLSKAGSLLSAASSKLGLGKVAGWLGKGGKLLGRFGGGVFGAALLAAPTLLDSQASAHDKGAAVGSGVGAVVGGTLGTLAGPVGAAIGSTVGSYLGDYLGGWLTDAYQKITGGNDNGSGQAVQKAAARVELVAPAGWDKRSIDIDDSDMFGLDLNFYSGGNYVPYG